MSEPESKPESRKLIDRISQITGGFRQSQILFVANAANIFQLLDVPKTARDVAKILSWDPRGTRMLLDGLLALELVGKKDDLYQNTEISSACLVPGAPHYQGDIVNHNYHLWRSWGSLDDAVRIGRCAIEKDERSNEDLRHFILGMENIARYSAREMLKELDLSRYRHMLDLGGGPATYSITFLQEYPDLRATLFDMPLVVEIAAEQVKAAGLEERFDYIEGDMLVDDLGCGYDMILLSNIIHSMGPQQVQDLFAKCRDALQPGGHLVIKDFLIDRDRSGPPFGLIFALNMLVNTEEGDTYTFSDMEKWTLDAGFSYGVPIDITPQSRLWVTEKPAL